MIAGERRAYGGRNSGPYGGPVWRGGGEALARRPVPSDKRSSVQIRPVALLSSLSPNDFRTRSPLNPFSRYGWRMIVVRKCPRIKLLPEQSAVQGVILSDRRGLGQDRKDPVRMILVRFDHLDHVSEAHR